MKHPACKTGDVPPGGEARVFSFFGCEPQVWRTGVRIRAAASECLHLGGPLECKDGAFVCSWHGARFHMADGSAPAGARLMFPLTRIGGEELVYVWGETP
ncbi:MAG: Rieske 2Fe-2S domain-containing protein [Pseudomonadota bacterium]|nr:Rieske 2Fe-2S domain-containing protein [Pseudomonadota bacterium]